MAGLVPPTITVRDSYLEGERAMCLEEEESADALEVAEADFAGFVTRRRQVRELWDVPTTELWYVDGADYIGTVMIRHRLTDALTVEGGHIGYHIVPAHRGKGHAKRLLAAAIDAARALGIERLVITCDDANIASRRVIEANSGTIDSVTNGVVRYLVKRDRLLDE